MGEATVLPEKSSQHCPFRIEAGSQADRGAIAEQTGAVPEDLIAGVGSEPLVEVHEDALAET